MTIFLWITFFWNSHDHLRPGLLAQRHLFSTARKSVAANLAISSAALLVERKVTDAKKARQLAPQPALSEAQAAAAVVSAHHELAVQQKEELARIDRELGTLPIEMTSEQRRVWFKLIVAKANITSPLPEGYWERQAAHQAKQIAAKADLALFEKIFWGLTKLGFGCLIFLVVLEGLDQVAKHYPHLAEPSSAATAAASEVPAQGDSFDRAFDALLKADPVSTPRVH